MILPGRMWLLAVTLGLSGCTGWYAHPDLLAQPIPLRNQVRLCVATWCRQVHAMRVAGDSVSAVPYFQAPDRDSCTLHFVLRDIDSVQTRRFNGSATAFVLVLTVPAAAALTYLVVTFPGD